MNLNFELYWILVPIVASAIGYSTNWVAIKMLFRPLHEKRIFGLRVPFTPGLVPRRKEEIADNIGQAVASHLVTSEAIEGRLNTPQVKAGLKEAILKWIDRGLEKDRGEIRELIPHKYESSINAFQTELASRLTEFLVAFIHSNAMQRTLAQLFEGLEETLEEKKVKQFLDRKSACQLGEKIGDILCEFMKKPDFERGVKYFWLKKLREFDHQEGNISSFFSDHLQELIIEQTDHWVPYLLQQGASLLNNPDFRGRVKEFLIEFINEKLQDQYDQDSLWDQVKYSFVELFVMGKEDIDARVEQAVKEGFPKLIALLEREDTREEIANHGAKVVRNLLNKDISSYNLSNSNTRKLATFLTRVSVEIARDEAVGSAIREIFEGLLDDLRNKEFNQLLDFSKEGNEVLKAISKFVLKLTRSVRVQKQMKSLIRGWIDTLSKKRLGRLSRWIERDDLEPLIEMIIEGSTNSISKEISELLSIINVRSLVKKEVNNFSTLEVEGLVLDVTGNQLRAITWFGALLGFFIGVVQLIMVILGG